MIDLTSTEWGPACSKVMLEIKAWTRDTRAVRSGMGVVGDG